MVRVGEHRDLARLKTWGGACAFVAVEADKLFAKGRQPSFGRRAEFYEASGPQTSPGFLGKLASGQYGRQVGQAGNAYVVQVSRVVLSLLGSCGVWKFGGCPPAGNHTVEDLRARCRQRCFLGKGLMRAPAANRLVPGWGVGWGTICEDITV